MSMGKILVVDDDINICELLRLYIEKEGYDVIIANDGGQAVTKFKTEKPNLAGVQRDTQDLTVPDNYADGKGRGFR